LVPIVADEARTFGMQTLFRQFGILFLARPAVRARDQDELLYYREARTARSSRRELRGGRAVVLAGRRHGVLVARHADAGFLHLLLDCSASSASAT